MSAGRLVGDIIPWPLTDAHATSSTGSQARGSSLHALALQWLKEDRETLRASGERRAKARGARKDDVSRARCVRSLLWSDGIRDTQVPTDSEVFFKK